MLKVGDKVYLHIGDIDKSINKVGFNKSRLCRITGLEPVRSEDNEKIGLYNLQAIYEDKTYNVLSNDKLWNISSADELVEVVKQSKYDNETIDAIVKVIYES